MPIWLQPSKETDLLLKTSFEEEVQYSLNYQKKFEKEGHTLTFDYQYSKGIDDENSIIKEVILGDNIALDTEKTIDAQTQISPIASNGLRSPFWEGRPVTI